MFLKNFWCFNLSPEIRNFELSQLVQILAKTKQQWYLEFIVNWSIYMIQQPSLGSLWKKIYTLLKSDKITIRWFLRLYRILNFIDRFFKMQLKMLYRNTVAVFVTYKSLKYRHILLRYADINIELSFWKLLSFGSSSILFSWNLLNALKWCT